MTKPHLIPDPVLLVPFQPGPQKRLLRQETPFLLGSLTQALVGDGEAGLLLVEVHRVSDRSRDTNRTYPAGVSLDLLLCLGLAEGTICFDP